MGTLSVKTANMELEPVDRDYWITRDGARI